MRVKYFIFMLLIPMLFTGFLLNEYSNNGEDVQQIVNRAIDYHDGKKYERSIIRFDFRGQEFTIVRDRGNFRYTRIRQKDGQLIKEMLTNEGYRQWRAGKEQKLSQAEKTRFGNSVNSVVYFALLPYGLNDSAVVKRYLGMETVLGKDYDRVEVTFHKQGG